MMTIFSKIIVGEIPAYKIAEDKMFIAFLDIFPVKIGHVLVVPKVEIDSFFELPDDYLSKILVFAKPIATAIAKAYPCNRVSLITVGLEVPHAHLHLIPMDRTEDMNLMNEKIKLSKEEFEEMQQKIASFL